MEKTIIHTNYLRDGGGEVRRIVMKCAGLRSRGFKMHIATPPDSICAKLAAERGIPMETSFRFSSGFRPMNLLRDVQNLRRMIERTGASILHVHGSNDTWVAALVKTLYFPELKVVRTRHNSFKLHTHIFNRWLYRKIIDRIVLVSESLKGEFEPLLKSGDVNEESMVVIPSAVDFKRFEVSESAGIAIRKELNLDASHPVIGLVGRLAQQKGHLVLLEALISLKRKHPNLKTLFVGKGGAEPMIRERVKSLGLKGDVIFMGYRTDVPAIVKACDVITLPSTGCDASPATIKEALLLERPCVASNIGGAREIIDEGRNGYIVPPGNAQALEEKLDILLNHPELRKEFGRNGSLAIRQKFSPEQLIEKNEALYRTILEGT